jgi:hypothetical protein
MLSGIEIKAYFGMEILHSIERPLWCRLGKVGVRLDCDTRVDRRLLHQILAVGGLLLD